jgi:hypothetical protein
MKNIKLKIYIPQGILNCKNLKEVITLHLLEHLISKNISKKLNISLYNTKGTVNFDYIRFDITISKSEEINIIQDIFKNLEQILQQSLRELEIEKNRILGEEKFNQYDLIRQLHQAIFIKIFKNFPQYTFGQLKNILHSITIEDILLIQKKYISYENLLIIKQRDKNKIQIFKKPYKISTPTNYLVNRNHYSIVDRSIPSSFVFILISDNDPEYLLFLKFLDKKHRNFFEENLIDKGLVYSYIQKSIYLLLDKIIFTLIIPTSRVNYLSKIYKKYFTNLFDLSSKKEFLNFKKSEIKRIKKNFFNFFEPYIIKSIFEYSKYPLKKDIFNELKYTKQQNITKNKLKLILIKINP